MAQITVIPFDQAIVGGIADSPYMGAKNSLASIVGFNLHRVPGLMTVNQKMALDSPVGGGAAIDDLVKILPLSNGDILYFGKTAGKVWKKSGGVYSFLGSITGSAGVFNAREYFGYVYYATAANLGRWQVGAGFGARNDTWAAFKNGDAVAHPMTDQNLVLYIGDGNVVAQVDASGEPTVPTVFSNQALLVLSTERVTALGTQGTNLLVGTKSLSNQNRCNLYNWNTWSRSFNQNDVIPENGVNAFMSNKQAVIVSAGENGNFYKYVKSLYGQYLEPLRQLPASFPTQYGPTQTGIIYPEAISAMGSIPIFGFSKLVGNPTLQGIYTIGGRNTQYPDILTLEYPISTYNLQNLTIWSVEVVGNDIYVSWKDETGGTAYGVDKLDYGNKVNGAYFETMIIRYTKVLMDRFKDFVVNYDQCPGGTSIDFYYSINHATYVKFDASEFVNDTDRMQFKSTSTLNAKTIQFKVVVNSSGNNAPNIEDAMTVLG